MKNLLVLLIGIGCTLTSLAQSDNITVVIIRHGEKNEATGNLSCKGLNRAMSIPKVLNAKYKKFSYIYVPTVTAGKTTGHARMLQTVTPLATQANISVNSNFTVNAADALAHDIMKRSGTVLLVWEHENIPEIAAALGVKDAPKWSDKDYDGIWVINFSLSKKGKQKAALAIDKEGLNPPDACNF